MCIRDSYGKYLPLIAQFSTELAGKKTPPNYHRLIGEGEVVIEGADGTSEAETETGSEVGNGKQEEKEQETIDQYSGS